MDVVMKARAELKILNQRADEPVPDLDRSRVVAIIKCVAYFVMAYLLLEAMSRMTYFNMHATALIVAVLLSSNVRMSTANPHNYKFNWTVVVWIGSAILIRMSALCSYHTFTHPVDKLVECVAAVVFVLVLVLSHLLTDTWVYYEHEYVVHVVPHIIVVLITLLALIPCFVLDMIRGEYVMLPMLGIIYLCLMCYVGPPWHIKPYKVDVVRELHELSKTHCVDVEVLAFVAYKTAYAAKTTRLIANIGSLTTEWLSKHKPHLSEIDICSQVTSVTRALLADNPVSRDLLSHLGEEHAYDMRMQTRLLKDGVCCDGSRIPLP